MPKPRMKNYDLSNVGGRIRKARIDASLTMKELSEKMEVSFAYLGMVERGEKNPSDKILTCVSETTGVPLDWLQNGDRVDEKGSKQNQSQAPHIADIDAALFLSIVMCENPSMSVDMIAPILNVDQDTLKGILSGEIKIDPAWETAFTLLAERLKISETLKKLCNVEFFFAHVEIKKIERALPILIKAIAMSLSEKFNDEFTCPDLDHDQEFCFDTWLTCRQSGFPVKDFSFTEKSESTQWDVALYLGLSKTQLGNLLFTATSSAQVRCDSTQDVLVFMDEENFRDAISFSNNRKSNDENYWPKVVAMCVDLDSKSVIGCEMI